MAPGSLDEKEFDKVINDIQKNMGGVSGENRGIKCMQFSGNFITPCQEVARYLIEKFRNVTIFIFNLMRNVKKIRMIHFAMSYSIKEAYDNRRSFLTPCSRFPRILPPPKVDEINELQKTRESLLIKYKEEDRKCEGYFRNLPYQAQDLLY
ncbi:hypothetical protein MKS88_000369 [Plasmodium brasilianum]|uniref:Uncharacterized protein n=1 Tax=Plasmodium brasilianum TaxID=5824 RepID=A0ACB9YF15_PLABR|nr:hypothetical protein MKS88_000369 [Plasmodium brasilianum]